MTDFSYLEQTLREQSYAIGEAWQRPSVLYRATVRDVGGRGWICEYGDVQARGDSPHEAVNNFDYYAWYGKPVPEKVKA